MSRSNAVAVKAVGKVVGVGKAEGEASDEVKAVGARKLRREDSERVVRSGVVRALAECVAPPVSETGLRALLLTRQAANLCPLM